MSTRPFPFRRRFSASTPLHGVGNLLDWTPESAGDPQLDPVERITEQDEGIAGSEQNPQPTITRGIHHVTFPRGVPNWENIDQVNYALLPAIGSSQTIITYVVPPGRNGIIYKVACNFVGGGWVEGSGDLIWRILVDGTPPPGANSYDSILASLGSPSSPTEISGFRLFENQVLTLVAFNNPAGAGGGVVVAGQRVGGRLVGWNYPTDIEENDIWI